MIATAANDRCPCGCGERVTFQSVSAAATSLAYPFLALPQLPPPPHGDPWPPGSSFWYVGQDPKPRVNSCRKKDHRRPTMRRSGGLGVRNFRRAA